MSFYDIFIMIRENIFHCFDIMKSIIIFEPGSLFKFSVSLYDIFLGLFTCGILNCLLGTYFWLDDDRDYTFNFDIFEDYDDMTDDNYGSSWF